MIDPISAVLPKFLASVASTNPLPTTVPGANSATGTNSAGTATGSSSSAAGGLDSNTFLKLLVSQIANQDPMKPTDSTTYITEEAEFSMVQAMNTMSTQNSAILSSQQMQEATGFIGKTVTYTDATGLSASGTVVSASPGSGGALVRVGGVQVPVTAISEVAAAGS
jgi:flagellar basal-body rod modification protein FlgD